MVGPPDQPTPSNRACRHRLPTLAGGCPRQRLASIQSARCCAHCWAAVTGGAVAGSVVAAILTITARLKINCIIVHPLLPNIKTQRRRRVLDQLPAWLFADIAPHHLRVPLALDLLTLPHHLRQVGERVGGQPQHQHRPVDRACRVLPQHRRPCRQLVRSELGLCLHGAQSL